MVSKLSETKDTDIRWLFALLPDHPDILGAPSGFLYPSLCCHPLLNLSLCGPGVCCIPPQHTPAQQRSKQQPVLSPSPEKATDKPTSSLDHSSTTACNMKLVQFGRAIFAAFFTALLLCSRSAFAQEDDADLLHGQPQSFQQQEQQQQHEESTFWDGTPGLIRDCSQFPTGEVDISEGGLTFLKPINCDSQKVGGLFSVFVQTISFF